MPEATITKRPTSQPVVLDPSLLRRAIEQRRPQNNREFFSQMPQGISGLFASSQPSLAQPPAAATQPVAAPAGPLTEFGLDRRSVLDTFAGPFEPPAVSFPLPGPAATSPSGGVAPVPGGEDPLQSLIRQKIMQQVSGGPSAERSMLERFIEADAEIPVSTFNAIAPVLFQEHASIIARRRGTTIDELVEVLKADAQLKSVTANAERLKSEQELAPLELDVRRINAVAALTNAQRPRGGGEQTIFHELLGRGIDTGDELQGLLAEQTGPPAPGKKPDELQQRARNVFTPEVLPKAQQALAARDFKAFQAAIKGPVKPVTDPAVKAFFDQINNSIDTISLQQFADPSQGPRMAKALTARFKLAKEKLSDKDLDTIETLLDGIGFTLDRKTGVISPPGKSQ